MGFIESQHETIGMAFSIAGLALVVPCVFLFKQYLRYFDHLQLTLLYWIMLAPTYQTFSSHLQYSWAKFIPNFLKFCTTGDLVCQLGFALSFTICLLGVILLMFLIVTFIKCRRSQKHFEPFYSVFKGFFRWTYLPLAYYSLSYLLVDIKAGTKTNFIASIIILAFTAIFPLIQLIIYKVIQQQKDQIWTKWFQFLGYYRNLSIVVIFVLGKMLETNTNIAKYFVYGSLVFYAVIFAWKGVFVHKIFERIIFILGEATAITVYSLYLFDPIDLVKYELDFIGLAIILLLDIIWIIFRIVRLIFYGKVTVENINPEEEANEEPARTFEVVKISEDFSIKKKSKYEEQDELQNSRDSLMNSPRKNTTGRKR